MSDDSKVPTAREVADELIDALFPGGNPLLGDRWGKALAIIERDRAATIEACARACEDASGMGDLYARRIRALSSDTRKG